MGESQDEAPVSRRERRRAAEQPAAAPISPVAVAEPPVVERPAATPKPRTPKKRHRVSVIGVIGELFLTAGVVVLLYVGWQMYIGDLIYGTQAGAEAQELSEQWQQEYEQSTSSATPTSAPDPTAAPASVEPPILRQPADAETFASMHIPRFGPEWAFEIAGGTSRPRTLDTVRIGHYTGDAKMPGEVGNFAVAAHRTTFGAPFNRIADLRVGDAIVVEVPQGWFTYRFRTLEYVKDTAVDVLLDVPQQPDVPAGDRYITMTSCSPMFSLAERIVGYGLFESFTPRSAGPPASLTEVPA